MPEGIRLIGRDFATSECIGDIATPRCAVETLISCRNRVWERGCAEVGWTGPERQPKRVEYVIEKMGFVDRAKVRAAIEKDKRDFEPISRMYHWLDYVDFQAKARERNCPAERTSCDGQPWEEILYNITPQAGLWVRTWYNYFVEYEWMVD